MLRRPITLLVIIGFAGVASCTGSSSATDPGSGATAAASETPTSTMPVSDPASPFYGGWEFVRVDRIGPDGEALPPPEPGSFGTAGTVGYLMYDPAGYMSVVIMQPDRQPYAGDRPTPEEALAAMRSYTAYFGTFTVNAAEGYVTHHLQGNLSPPASANDNQRFYELSGDQLTLMPPVGDTGVQLKISWQRLPALPESQLTDTHRKLFGFYRIDHVERHTLDGEEIPRDQYDNAFISYVPSGHMAVHLMRPNRPMYTGAPTPDDALAAMTTYSSYFGPFTVHEDEGYLVHHRIGSTNPASTGTDAQRFYELTDTTLTLRPPVSTDDQGRQGQSALVWRRLTN